MGRPSSHSKKMRNLVGILKDKVSLIKATLLLSKKTNAFHVAVLQATTHAPTHPPPLSTVEDVLTVGRHHGTAASAIVDSLFRRLRRTRNAYVALKCLLTLHHLLTRGSPVFKAQIVSAIGPHNNLLNLCNFRDDSDADTWELSRWVRWYAGVLERGLSSLFYLYPLTGQSPRTVRERIEEMGDLVGMVVEICRSPESLHYQRISLVYEVIKLVGEDYRKTMREILARIPDLGSGIEDLKEEEFDDFLKNLKKMEECKEKVVLMFMNKKMNDGGWDLITQTREEIQAVKRRRESLRLVVRIQGKGKLGGGGGGGGGEIRTSKPRGKRWLDVPWNPLVVQSLPQVC